MVPVEDDDDDDEDDELAEESAEAAAEETQLIEQPVAGAELVGSWIRVFWEGNGVHFVGLVVSFVDGKHKVNYEDGDTQEYKLSEEAWEEIESRPKLVKSSDGIELQWSGTKSDGNTGYTGVECKGPRQFEATIPGHRTRKQVLGAPHASAVEAAVARARKLAEKQVLGAPYASAVEAAVARPRKLADSTAVVIAPPAALVQAPQAPQPPRVPPRVPQPRLLAPANDLLACLDGFEDSVAGMLDVEQLEQLRQRLHAVTGAVACRVVEVLKQRLPPQKRLEDPD